MAPVTACAVRSTAPVARAVLGFPGVAAFSGAALSGDKATSRLIASRTKSLRLLPSSLAAELKPLRMVGRRRTVGRRRGPLVIRRCPNRGSWLVGEAFNCGMSGLQRSHPDRASHWCIRNTVTAR